MSKLRLGAIGARAPGRWRAAPARRLAAHRRRSSRRSSTGADPRCSGRMPVSASASSARRRTGRRSSTRRPTPRSSPAPRRGTTRIPKPRPWSLAPTCCARSRSSCSAPRRRRGTRRETAAPNDASPPDDRVRLQPQSRSRPRRARLMATDGGIGDIEQTTIHMGEPHPRIRRGRVPPITWAMHAASRRPSTSRGATRPPSGGGYGQGQPTHYPGAGAVAHRAPGGRGLSSFMYTPEWPGRSSSPTRWRSGCTNGGVGSVAGAACHQRTTASRSRSRAIGHDGQIHVDLERQLVWRFRPGRDDITKPDHPRDVGQLRAVVDDSIDLVAGRNDREHLARRAWRTVVEVLWTRRIEARVAARSRRSTPRPSPFRPDQGAAGRNRRLHDRLAVACPWSTSP